MSTTSTATYIIGPDCPWPQRRGAQAHIVTPGPGEHDTYPYAGLDPNDAVIWIPDDPLGHHQCEHPAWSCVMPRRHLQLVTGPLLAT